MSKRLLILSQITKFIFYGMMVYFMILVVGILSGSYRFAETNTAFYYMVVASIVAACSLLLRDLHGFLAKRRSKAETGAKGLDHGDSEGSEKMS